jgi:hypothetical protein
MITGMEPERLTATVEATGPASTAVTLTYDWSAVGPEVREHLHFPPFEPDHLDRSLQHLARLVDQVE